MWTVMDPTLEEITTRLTTSNLTFILLKTIFSLNVNTYFIFQLSGNGIQ